MPVTASIDSRNPVSHKYDESNTSMTKAVADNALSETYEDENIRESWNIENITAALTTLAGRPHIAAKSHIAATPKILRRICPP